jgi:solute:Na+ symporter, SSS family
LLETGLTVASFPLGSLLGLFLLGSIDRRANSTGALTGMFCGLAAIIGVREFSSVAYTWYVLVGACMTFLVGASVSRLDRKDAMQFETSGQAAPKREIG